MWAPVPLSVSHNPAMILNLRCKLSIFGEETWSDLDPEEYSDRCRTRFQFDYLSSPTANASPSPGITHSAPVDDDDEEEEFQAHLGARAAKSSRTTHDYDLYVNFLKRYHNQSAPGWWRANHPSFLYLRKMARDPLAVPAIGSSVKRMFSIARHVATWQRSRLRDSTIANIMMYKAAMNLEEVSLELEAEEDLLVPEWLGKIPVE
jgi:hypothetical protein